MLSRYRGRRVELLSPLVVGRKGYYTELAQWAADRGFDTLRVDGERLPTASWPRLDRFQEHDIELPVGRIVAVPEAERELAALLRRALDYGAGRVAVQAAGERGKPALFSVNRACPVCRRSFPELDPRFFSYNSAHGWCGRCRGAGTGAPLGEDDVDGRGGDSQDGQGAEAQVCTACSGARLCPESLAVYFKDRNIADYLRLSVSGALRLFERLELAGRAARIAADALDELTTRLKFLGLLGLDYLALDRAAPTLSGGEAQRIRLAAQLGSNLRGVCYILDEPTIGLHPRDNGLLLQTLERLRSKGNTVVVVEHDEATIRRADHLIDLGPGAGREGGEVVASGTLADVLGSSRFGYRQDACQAVAASHEPPVDQKRSRRRLAARHRSQPSQLAERGSAFAAAGADLCYRSVSGSGKSTLVRDVLFDNVRKRLLRRRGQVPAQGLRGIGGLAGAGPRP